MSPVPIILSVGPLLASKTRGFISPRDLLAPLLMCPQFHGQRLRRAGRSRGMIFLHGAPGPYWPAWPIRNRLRQPFLDHLRSRCSAERANEGFGPADRRRGGRRRHSPVLGVITDAFGSQGRRHHRTERRMALSGFPHRRNQCPFEESLTSGISPTTLNGCIRWMHPFLLHKNSRTFRYGVGKR